MSVKFHVKKNDEVEVISGAHKGRTGKILQVLTKKNRVIVEGVGLFKKAARPTQENPRGGFEEREGTIHISNVKKIESQDKAKGKKKSKAEASAKKGE